MPANPPSPVAPVGTRAPEWRKATLHGVRVWVAVDLAPGIDGGIAPEDHVTPDGFLDWTRCFATPSYAHLYPGDPEPVIKRHGRRIGVLSDLVDGWPERAASPASREGGDNA